MMGVTNINKIPQSKHYRVGDNLHGAFSQPYPTLESAKEQREVFISGAMERLHGSSLSPEEARTLAEDWYWVCDDNEKIID
jgi:hypothetical protein